MSVDTNDWVSAIVCLCEYVCESVFVCKCVSGCAEQEVSYVCM